MGIRVVAPYGARLGFNSIGRSPAAVASSEAAAAGASRYGSQVTGTVAIISLWLVILVVPAYYKWPLVVLFGAQILCALMSTEVSLYAFLATGPLFFVVRLANLSDPWLASLREVAFVLLCLSWLLQARNYRGCELKRCVPPGFCVLCALFALGAIRAASVEVAILSLRETLRFWMLFPIIVAMVGSKPICARRALHWILAGCVLLSAVELITYFSGWTPVARVLTETDVSARQIGQFLIPRAVPLNLASGVAGFTDIVAPGIAMATIFAVLGRRHRLLALAGASGMVLFSALTFSYSLLGYAGLAGAALLLVQIHTVGRRGRASMALMLAGGVVVTLVATSFFVNFGGRGSGSTLLDYARYFIEQHYLRYVPSTDNLAAVLLGHGLRYTGGAKILGDANALNGWGVRMDPSWSLLLFMLGVPGGLAIIAWLVSIAVRGVQSAARERSEQAKPSGAPSTLLLAAVALLTSFGAVHNIPWMIFSGPDGSFIALAAIVYTLASLRGRPPRRVFSQPYRTSTGKPAWR